MNPDEIQPIIDEIVGKSWTYGNTVGEPMITKKSPDLRDVSTRDLLNEAFRRGAIKQMSYSQDTPKEYLEDSKFSEHMNRAIMKDSLLQAADELYQNGVFNLGMKTDDERGMVTFTSDYFICIHPLTLKANGQ